MLNNTKRTMSNLTTLKTGLNLIQGKKEETRKPSSLFDDIFETRKPAPKKKKSNDSSLFFDILSDLTEEKKETKPSINITIDTRETHRPNYCDPFAAPEGYSKWNSFERNVRNRSGKIVIICNDNSSYRRDFTLIEHMMCDASIKYRDYQYVYCRSWDLDKYIEEISNGGRYESYIFIGFPLRSRAKMKINEALRKQSLTHREMEKYINWITSDMMFDRESWIRWYHTDDYRVSWVNNPLCATLSYICDAEILSNYEKEYLFRKYTEQTRNW